MGKKRNHQVTRSILKSFPTEAKSVFEGKGHKETVENSEEAVSFEASEKSEYEGDEVEHEISEDSDFDDMKDDEFELDSNVSDAEEEIADDEDDLDDLHAPKNKKSKKSEIDLGSAIANILSEKVTQEGTAPILARRKGIERKIEDERLEARARSVMKRELRETKDAAHITSVDPTSLNYEKQLRKAATRGAVQLFNAIQQHQMMKEKLVKEKQAKKNDEIRQIKEISKTSFLDMLKGGSSAQIKKQES